LGEREGDASALTAARNAENLKNVAATDSFGNLPTMNAGEISPDCSGVTPRSTAISGRMGA
jgi:hypothetical protein